MLNNEYGRRKPGEKESHCKFKVIDDTNHASFLWHAN